MLEFVLVFFLRRSHSHGGGIVHQCVQPHVDHVRGIARHRDAPLHAGAADGKVAQAGAHERHHFVAASLRTDKFRMLLIMPQQFLFHRRQLEEIIFFAHRFGGTPALRTRRARPGIVHVQLVVHAILPGIAAFVDESFFLQAAEHPLHAAGVALFGGADKIVVGDAHGIPQRAILARDPRGELLRRNPRRRRRTLDLLSMLVGAGEKQRVLAQHAVVARHRVAGDGGVRMPNVRRRVDVKNRRRDVELGSGAGRCFLAHARSSAEAASRGFSFSR